MLGNVPDNERLEFLGDRVLGLVLAQTLLEKFKNDSEGQIAKRLAWLASAPVLANVAKNICLPENIIFYKENLPQAERESINVIADSMEALLAALYLDAGLELVKNFIVKNWADFLNKKDLPKDDKTELQEISQTKFNVLPVYEVVQKTGAEHAPNWEIKVSVGKFSASAEGENKKIAEKNAAAKLIKELKNVG